MTEKEQGRWDVKLGKAKPEDKSGKRRGRKRRRGKRGKKKGGDYRQVLRDMP
jgi:hypothetical protein